MRTAIVITLLYSPAANHFSNAQDKLVDELLDRVFKAWSFHHSNLDETTLVKTHPDINCGTPCARSALLVPRSPCPIPFLPCSPFIVPCSLFPIPHARGECHCCDAA